MSEGNGFTPVVIDVTNDQEFKTGMVKYMQMLMDRTDCLPAVKKKVDTHEKIVYASKWLGGPILVILHVTVKAGLKKFFGWG